jgi:O-antigen/teichoic acid export membrane protein
VCLVHLKELMGFSMWLTAGQIVDTLNWRFDHLIVGKGLSTAALGHYTVGSTLALIPTRETTAPLDKMIYPAFAGIRGDKSRLAAAYQRAQTFVTAVALPAGVGAALIADPVIRLTMGEKWEPAIFVIQVLASVFALQTLGSLSQPLYMALGETKLLFIRNLQMLCIRVPLIAAGMFLGGLQGIVLARVVSGLTGIVFALRLVRRATGLGWRQQLSPNTRAFAGVTAMTLAVVLISRVFAPGSDPAALSLKIAVQVALGAVVYCGTTLGLWHAMGRPAGPEREMGELLSKALTRFRSKGAR